MKIDFNKTMYEHNLNDFKYEFILTILLNIPISKALITK